MSDPSNEEQARESVHMAPVPLASTEIQAAASRPLAAETVTAPSVTAGPTGLAWWDAMKFFWKNSANGGHHLAPQDSYTADVLDRGNVYVNKAASDLSKDDLKDYTRVSNLFAELVQEFKALDPTEIESQAWLRFIQNRGCIARKIAGVSAVSAEHRVINAEDTGRTEAEIDAMKADVSDKGYYASDIEKRNRWAEKTCIYEFLADKNADGDVISTVATEFAAKSGKHISRAMYDDAVEKGNRLKRPSPAPVAGARTRTREELLAMTA